MILNLTAWIKSGLPLLKNYSTTCEFSRESWLHYSIHTDLFKSSTASSSFLMASRGKGESQWQRYQCSGATLVSLQNVHGPYCLQGSLEKKPSGKEYPLEYM